MQPTINYQISSTIIAVTWILVGGHKVSSLFQTDFGDDILVLIEIIMENLKMIHKTQCIITLHLARKICNVHTSKSHGMVWYLSKNIFLWWASNLLSIYMFFLFVSIEVYLRFYHNWLYHIEFFTTQNIQNKDWCMISTTRNVHFRFLLITREVWY